MARRYQAQALEDRDDAILAIGGTEYRIPDRVTVPIMTKFMRIHRIIRETEDENELASALEEAHQAVLDYVRLQTPEANFQLDARELAGVIGFVIGTDQTDAEAEVVDALTDSGRATASEAPDGETKLDAGDEAGPLASPTPSHTLSSLSGNGSGGSQGTTEVFSGATSGSTSPTSSVT